MLSVDISILSLCKQAEGELNRYLLFLFLLFLQDCRKSSSYEPIGPNPPQNPLGLSQGDVSLSYQIKTYLFVFTHVLYMTIPKYHLQFQLENNGTSSQISYRRHIHCIFLTELIILLRDFLSTCLVIYRSSSQGPCLANVSLHSG